MSLASVAVVFVAVAFTALVVWVCLPRNRDRLEAHGAIPLDEPHPQSDRHGSR
jgi:hypothetical protein